MGGRAFSCYVDLMDISCGWVQSQIMTTSTRVVFWDSRKSFLGMSHHFLKKWKGV